MKRHGRNSSRQSTTTEKKIPAKLIRVSSGFSKKTASFAYWRVEISGAHPRGPAASSWQRHPTSLAIDIQPGAHRRVKAGGNGKWPPSSLAPGCTANRWPIQRLSFHRLDQLVPWSETRWPSLENVSRLIKSRFVSSRVARGQCVNRAESAESADTRPLPLPLAPSIRRPGKRRRVSTRISSLIFRRHLPALFIDN